jgi:hypothetical protein
MDNYELFAVTLREGNKHIKFCVAAASPNDAREKVISLVEKQGLEWKTNSVEPEPIAGVYFGNHDGVIIPLEEAAAVTA